MVGWAARRVVAAASWVAAVRRVVFGVATTAVSMAIRLRAAAEEAAAAESEAAVGSVLEAGSVRRRREAAAAGRAGFEVVTMAEATAEGLAAGWEAGSVAEWAEVAGLATSEEVRAAAEGRARWRAG